LQEFGTLVKFLRVSPFDDGASFRDMFTHAIERDDERGWERLRSLVQAISLRRTKQALDLKLPVREEIIQPVELNMEERKMYKLFTKSCVSAIETRGMARSTLQNILRLRQICNHGRELLPSTTQKWLDSVMSFYEGPITPPPTCEHCDDPMADSEENMEDLISCLHQVCKACLRYAQEDDGSSEPVCPICAESECGKKKEVQDTDEMEVETEYHPSSKVKALLENLQKTRWQSQYPKEMPIKRY
jgi:SNF2 family DNA or RNA helicase